MRCYVHQKYFFRPALLNRYTVEKPYRGFESLRLRHNVLQAYVVVTGTAMSKPGNRWYRAARILAFVFAIATVVTIVWVILSAGYHSATAGESGGMSALLIPVVSLGTMLLSAIGTGSTVVLGWGSERRANREFALKIRILEAERKRGPDRHRKP